MSDSERPKIMRKSIKSKMSSSLRISRKAVSGGKPLPIAVTTSLAFKSKEGSFAFSQSTRVTLPSVLISSLTSSFSSINFLILPSGPINIPTRSFGILTNMSGRDIIYQQPFYETLQLE